MNKPTNFDGAKFAAKYNLDPFRDFYDDGNGNIICPSLPNLSDADLLDCVTDPPSPYEVFKKPIVAPAIYADDIFVSSRKIKDDPEEAFAEALVETGKAQGEPKSLDLISRSTLEALQEAITESKRGEGQNKSLGLILLSVTKYIEQLHEEIEAMKTEIAELKKRVK